MTNRVLLITILIAVNTVLAIAVEGQEKQVEPCWKTYETSTVYMTQSNSLIVAKGTARHNVNGKIWYEYLPCCPATEAEARNLNYRGERDWDEDKAKTYIDCFHKGADTCFRSVRSFQSPTSDARHGQQCCYQRGRLLVAGEEGAGSPDFYAPISLSHLPWSHRNTDVLPWGPLGWRTYQQYWKPNSGGNCLFRVYMPKGDWIDTGLEVKAGQQFQITAEGNVVLGAEGSSSGPGGSDVIAESRVASIPVPAPFPNYRTGALVGSIIHQEIVQPANRPKAKHYIMRHAFFLVGEGGVFKAPKNGRLWLVINDAVWSNNEGFLDVAIQRVR